MQILLIEDNNLNQTRSLIPNLENQKYQVAVAHTSKMAAQKTETIWPNLVIFNANNSDLKLSSLQKAINKINLNIPYVVVGDESSQPGTNGDTIFVASGNLEQLNQGIEKAMVRQKDRFIRLPDLIIDCQQRQILRKNQCYHLTPKGFKLLHLLIDYKDRDLSRRVIMKQVWETDYMGDTRTLDVHIRWLREKIEDNPSRPRRLVTIRGVGYRFITEPE
jgi:DNA-binding response OmpR family regulator